MRVMFKLVSGAAALAVSVPTVALAVPHGKPGLWNYVSTVQMANMPKMPPAVLEMMKKRGVPAMGDAVTSQMCMTAEQAKMEVPPQLKNAGVNCTPRVISQTAKVATALKSKVRRSKTIHARA